MIASPRSLPLTLALALGLVAPVARAQDLTVSSAAPAALLVQLDVARSGLDAETVRQAIESELGVPVRLVARAEEATLAVVADVRHRATAVAKSNGDRVERKIDLPTDGAQATESIAWLAGNLARDEAAELIAALRPELAPRPTETESEEEARTEAPAPTPPPPPPKPKAKPAAKPPPTKRSDADAGATEATRYPFDPRRPVNLTLAHPLAIFPDVDQRTVRLEFGLGYSLVGAIRGIGFNPGVLRTRGPVHGVAASMGFTQTGPVEGVALSVGAVSIERVHGAEIAVGAALAERDIEGAQVAVGATIAGGSVKGAQLGMGANLAGGAVEGLQMAAGANLSGSSLRGVQVSGLLNSAGDVNGGQVGLVNIGKTVKGLQLGLVNIADEQRGLSLGLVNVTRDTRVQAVTWTSREEYANVGIKIVSGHIYTALGAGFRFDSKEAASDLGIGLHFDVGPLYLEPGFHYNQGYGETSTGGIDDSRWNDFIYRAALGWDLVNGFGVFGGAGLRHPIVEPDPGLSMTYFAGITLFGGRSKPVQTARR